MTQALSPASLKKPWMYKEKTVVVTQVTQKSSSVGKRKRKRKRERVA
jgi:hypothetical protein